MKVKVYKYVGSYGGGLQFVEMKAGFCYETNKWKYLGKYEIPKELLKQLDSYNKGIYNAYGIE